jgi:hypothetical protein
MQSLGQLYLTRLQLNVHVPISDCRARTRAYVSGLDIKYKERRRRKKEKGKKNLELNRASVTYRKRKNVSIFFNSILENEE